MQAKPLVPASPAKHAPGRENGRCGTVHVPEYRQHRKNVFPCDTGEQWWIDLMLNLAAEHPNVIARIEYDEGHSHRPMADATCS